MYRIEYLPVARQDMVEIAQYISGVLNNPEAADNLAEEMIKKVNKLSDAPYANPAYFPVKPLKHEYRKLLVGNYLILYWIDEADAVVTVARVIYAKRDYGRLLE